MTIEQSQVGYTDAYILMTALWRDQKGGATYKDLIAVYDGFAKMAYSPDELAIGFACLEAAGLVRVAEGRVIATDRARALHAENEEIRSSPDYATNPERYGGEKLARIVESGATKSYEQFELLWQALQREFAFRETGPGATHEGMSRHPLYSEERHRQAREELRGDFEQFMK